MQDAKGFFQGVSERNVRYPLRVADAISYMGDINDAFAAGTPCQFPPVAEAYAFSTGPNYDFEEPEAKEGS